MAVGRSLDLQPPKRLNPLNFHISQFGVIVSITVTTRLLRRDRPAGLKGAAVATEEEGSMNGLP